MKSKLLGGALLLGSIAVMLNAFNILPNIPIMLVWITVVFGGWFINSVLKLRIFGLVVSFLVLFQTYNGLYHWVNITNGVLIVVGIMAYLGLKLLLKTKTSPFTENVIISINGGKNSHSGKQSLSVLFGEVTRYVDTLKKPNYNCHVTLGEGKIYFTNTVTDYETIRLHVSVTLGELVVFVPRSWAVTTAVNTTFGELNHTGYASVKEKTLIIEGAITLGEVTVVYV